MSIALARAQGTSGVRRPLEPPPAAVYKRCLEQPQAQAVAGTSSSNSSSIFPPSIYRRPQLRHTSASTSAPSTSTAISSHPKSSHVDKYQDKIASYLSSLNDEQQEAIHSTNSVVRVKAGPGSGKTRVVTARVANLLRRGEPTSSILVITFTNKAASELKERLQSILGDGGGTTGVTAGTFHSISARILRNFIEDLPSSSPAAASSSSSGMRQLDTLNLSKSFTILDTDDSKRAMRQVVEPLILDGVPKQYASLAKVLTEIYSHIRSQFATVHNGFSWHKAMDKLDLDKYLVQILPLREKDLPKCFDDYDRECRENNAVDFDDLLSLTVALLQQAPAVRQQLHERWKHVLVDEFQDTNAAQYEMVRLLRGCDASRCSTFVVGDSDQAIYSWRGANPDNMDIEFKKVFPSCDTLFLSRNYRSATGIVDTAEAVLSHQGLPSLHRRGLPMKAHKGHVQHFVADSERPEPSWVKDKIQEHMQDGDTRYNEIAIIYRTKTQSRPFQEALAKARIPFKVLGEKPFWSRSEIKVMTCYLRLTVNPGTDSMALEEVINMPARKIGKKSVETLREVARGESISLASLLLGDLKTIPPLTAEELQPLLNVVEVSGALPPDALDLIPDVGSQLSKELKLNKPVLAGLKQLRAVIYLARSTAMHRRVKSVVKLLQLTSGFLKLLEEEDDNIKVQNLCVLLNVSSNQDEWIGGEEDLKRQLAAGGSPQLSGLEQLQLFLQHVALIQELDELKDKDKDAQRVTLMTIHASKGLEFKHVFFVGLVDGLIPLVRKTGEVLLSPKELDKILMEEKRLAYVGCTRAMESLYLVRAKTRVLYGDGPPREIETKPSRFFPSFGGRASI